MQELLELSERNAELEKAQRQHFVTEENL